MFLVEFDPSQNLLTARFTGRVEAAQMEECRDRIQSLLADVQPGWRMLTDLSELDSMDPDCVTPIRETMKFCNGKGVAMVARVIPDARKDIGYGLLTIFHYDPKVRIAACDTLDEAHRLLALP